MLLTMLVTVTQVQPSAAAAPSVSAATDSSGFPIFYADASGTRLDSCLDASDPHCPLLPLDGVFDPALPISFPDNFPDEFFYSAVDSDRIVTPGCAGATDETALPGTAQATIALEGAFANGLPAINEQMVFARIRFTVRGGLCANTTYTFTHPYGSIDLTTDEVGGVKPSPGTVDVGCLPTPQTRCDFSMALSGQMFTNGNFLRWDPAVEPQADPGYLGGDIATLHPITGGIDGQNLFRVTETATGTVVTETDLFTVAGRLAGPVVSDRTAVNFGGVVLDQSRTKTIVLTNVGADPWFVQPGGLTIGDPEFSVTNSTCPTGPAAALPRDGSCQVDITFTPTGVTGPRPSDPATPIDLSIVHSGLHSPYLVSLEGTGINAGDVPSMTAQPGSLQFGEGRMGFFTDSQIITITNPATNGAPLEVQGVVIDTDGRSLDGTDKDAFHVTYDTCTDAIVAAGSVESCQIAVSFKPTDVRQFAASVLVSANVSGGVAAVELSGTGIGGVAKVSKNGTDVGDGAGVVEIDPSNGFPVWYQDEYGYRVGQCLDVTDPYCVVLPDPFYTGGPVGGIVDGQYQNFPEEFFWYQAESEAITTPGCAGTGEGSAFVVIAGEGAFVNGDPIVGEAASFGRIRIVADGLCPNTDYTIVHPYGEITLTTDDGGNMRRNTSTQDIGCLPLPGEQCNWDEALASPVFGGFVRQIDAPPGYLGDPAQSLPVTGSPYVAQREIDLAGAGGVPAHANYFRIYQTDNPAAYDAEIDRFVVMGKLVGPMEASPSPASFGSVDVGSSSAPQTVTVTNDGEFPADVVGLSIAGANAADFSIGVDGCSGVTLGVQESCDLAVVFTPTATGARAGDLFVETTGLNGTLDVKLTGVGAASGSAAISTQVASVQFPPLHVGQVSASEPIRISNVGGTAPLEIASIVTTDPALLITDNGCLTPVAPDDECVVQVAFAPTAEGVVSGELIIDHNAPLTIDPLPVPLSGRGSLATPAQSGVLTPSGFQTWYQDNNGVRLEACLEPGDPGCVLLPDAGYDPAQPISFPGNFPTEFFWYLAETDPTFAVSDPSCGATGSMSIRIATEGTFLSPTPLDGQQLTFNRIRIDATGLCANTQYQFVHPYGTTSLVTDGAGDVRSTEDLEDVINTRPLGAAPDQPVGGGFLSWDPVRGPAAPTGYLGDAVTFHQVVGSTYRPDGPGTEPANYLELRSSGGVALGRTDQFLVAGKLVRTIEADVTSLAFGNQDQGTSSASKTVTVRNLSVDSITVTPTLTGPDATVFEIVGGSCTDPTPVGPDATCTVDVALSPAIDEPTGPKAATVEIGFDGPRSPATVALSGTVTEVGQAQIVVTPANVVFGNQPVGTTSAPHDITVSSGGAQALALSSVTLTGADADQFTIVNSCPASLASGAECTITARFAPTTAANVSAQVVITSNDPAQPTISVELTGTGAAAVVEQSVTELSFSTKGSSTKRLQLTNTGTAPLDLVGNPAIVITGTGAGTFTTAIDNCNNVAPGARCRIDVTFAPGAGPRNQTFDATLTVSTNAINSPTIVSLSGTRR